MPRHFSPQLDPTYASYPSYPSYPSDPSSPSYPSSPPGGEDGSGERGAARATGADGRVAPSGLAPARVDYVTLFDPPSAPLTGK